MTYEVIIGGKSHRVELQRDPDHPGLWAAHIDGRELRFTAVPAGSDVLSIVVDGRSFQVLREASAAAGDAAPNIVINGRRYAAELRDPRALRSRRTVAEAGGPKKILSPMPGKVIRLLAAEGDRVEAGAGVIVIEAMKMQNELKAPKQGVVKKLPSGVGSAVNAGDVLAIIE
ncbi:MAG TPA: biotin/lipoyl-containing protein [Terriglobales bacterium]|nr:biotin/lipoyl-containing protein [Terriglobales bacterium]